MYFFSTKSSCWVSISCHCFLSPPCLIEERFSGHGCHTLYFYITTVVINEKKRSLDVLCIEIIIYVQNALFSQIFFCQIFSTTQTKKVAIPRQLSGPIPEWFRKKTGFRPDLDRNLLSFGP